MLGGTCMHQSMRCSIGAVGMPVLSCILSDQISTIACLKHALHSCLAAYACALRHAEVIVMH